MLFKRPVGVVCLFALTLAPSSLSAQDAALDLPPVEVHGEESAPTPSPAEEVEADPTAQLFAKKCASCHTLGDGPRVGPDLKDVHLRRDRGWLLRLVQEPSKMLSSDPDARKLLVEYKGVKMPDLGLSDEETAALVDLMERCSAEPCDLSGSFTPVTDATPLDIDFGRQLYVGLQPLKNGGPSCLSCHVVAGMGGIVAGGTLGADLTHSFARLGDEGMDAALSSPPFPVMNKIFDKQPLEADEAFAIRAFLDQANKAQPEDEDYWSLAFLGIIGALTVLILLNAIWRKRLRGVRMSITRHATREV